MKIMLHKMVESCECEHYGNTECDLCHLSSDGVKKVMVNIASVCVSWFGLDVIIAIMDIFIGQVCY